MVPFLSCLVAVFAALPLAPPLHATWPKFRLDHAGCLPPVALLASPTNDETI
ncbi:hypothetical protein J3E69DRAFT_326796 [Trichoderma sp. SZMC 28015]